MQNGVLRHAILPLEASMEARNNAIESGIARSMLHELANIASNLSELHVLGIILFSMHFIFSLAPVSSLLLLSIIILFLFLSKGIPTYFSFLTSGCIRRRYDLADGFNFQKYNLKILGTRSGTVQFPSMTPELADPCKRHTSWRKSIQSHLAYNIK